MKGLGVAFEYLFGDGLADGAGATDDQKTASANLFIQPRFITTNI
jgi:hypothetical protein